MTGRETLYKLYEGREEAPIDDELYTFSKQRNKADLIRISCDLLETKLDLGLAKAEATEATDAERTTSTLCMTICGAQAVGSLPASTPSVYVKVRCGEAVFHTHPFERDSDDWASAPMEMNWAEVDEDKTVTLSVVDEAGIEVGLSEPVDINIPVGGGFDRWVFVAGKACLRLQCSHRGSTDVAPTRDIEQLELQLQELLSKRRHLDASKDSGLPPMHYATYTTIVAEVERRLCSEIEVLRAELDRAPPRKQGVAALGASRLNTSVIRVNEENNTIEVSEDASRVSRSRSRSNNSVIHVIDNGDGVEVVETHSKPAPIYVQTPPATTYVDNGDGVQKLLATINARDNTIATLQAGMSELIKKENPTASETVLLMSSQLAERDTTLAAIKADLPPMCLASLVVDQSNVINTLLAQLYKAHGSLDASSLRMEQLCDRVGIWDIPPKPEEPEPTFTQAQMDALLLRLEEAETLNQMQATSLADLHEFLACEGTNNDPRDIVPYLQRSSDDLIAQLEALRDGVASACALMDGEPSAAAEYRDELSTPIRAGKLLWGLGSTLDQVGQGIAKANEVLQRGAESSSAFMNKAQEKIRTLKAKLKARDQDLDEMMADHEAYQRNAARELAAAERELARLAGATGLADKLKGTADSNARLRAEMDDQDDIIRSTIEALINLLPKGEQAYYRSLPPHDQLPALLEVLKGANLNLGVPGIRIYPTEMNGVPLSRPYVVGQLGKAVQQTDAGEEGEPMPGAYLEYSLENPESDLLLSLCDKDRGAGQAVARGQVHLDKLSPNGSWHPLEGGGEVKLVGHKCRIPHPDSAANQKHQASKLAGEAGDMSDLTNKLEQSVDALAPGGSKLRPQQPSWGYLHKLADYLWELIHMQKEAVAQAKADAARALERSKTLLVSEGRPTVGSAIIVDGSGAKSDKAKEAEEVHMQFLMKSRAGLIRRIWACMEIIRGCHRIVDKHYVNTTQNKGHKMTVGQFKSTVEDVGKIIEGTGDLQDGLAWIVSNYFTDDEKLDLGTSPHLFKAADGGVNALPGLIESTAMIEARKLAPGASKAHHSKMHPEPAHYDHNKFQNRLADAHMTVLDSRDGVMDGKYYGHELPHHGKTRVDGGLHGIQKHNKAF